jgi:hypothetical protein
MKRNYLVLSVLIFFSMSCDFRGENLDQQDLKTPSLEILHEIDLKKYWRIPQYPFRKDCIGRKNELQCILI